MSSRVARLTGGDPEERVRALHELVLDPELDAAPALAAALEDPELAQLAAVSLARMLPAPSVADACAAMLGSDTAVTRELAVSLLDTDGVRERYGQQLAWLSAGDPSTEVRRAAVRALGSLGSERAGEALVAACADPAAEVRLVGIQASSRLAPEQRIPILLRALEDTDARVRDTAGRRLLAELLLEDAPTEGGSLVEQLRELASSDGGAASEAGRLLEQARSWR